MDALRQDFFDKALRQVFDTGIESRNGRILEFRDARGKFLHNIHSCNPFLGTLGCRPDLLGDFIPKPHLRFAASYFTFSVSH